MTRQAKCCYACPGASVRPLNRRPQCKGLISCPVRTCQSIADRSDCQGASADRHGLTFAEAAFCLSKVHTVLHSPLTFKADGSCDHSVDAQRLCARGTLAGTR